RQLNNVVLPAPFGPMSPRIWPPSNSNETPSSATIPPNRTATSRTSSSVARRIHPPVRLLRRPCRPHPDESSRGQPGFGPSLRGLAGIVWLRRRQERERHGQHQRQRRSPSR